MVDGVNLYGGFAGDETAADQADPIGRTTLLNGNIGSTGSTQDNSLHVVTIDPGVRLRWDGISVFGGNANASGVDQQRGGGLLNAGSLVMNRSGFWSNHAQQHGGAIYNSGEIVITRSDLVGNMAAVSLSSGRRMARSYRRYVGWTIAAQARWRRRIEFGAEFAVSGRQSSHDRANDLVDPFTTRRLSGEYAVAQCRGGIYQPVAEPSHRSRTARSLTCVTQLWRTNYGSIWRRRASDATTPVEVTI